MEDVKQQSAPNTGEENSQPTPQTVEQTQQTNEVERTADQNLSMPKQTQDARTVPYQALDEERRKRKELQREIAKFKSQQGLEGLDPNDLESIRNHPYVQDLELKQAEAELRRGAEEILQRAPHIPDAIKKAIIRNPRGYVDPKTTDVPSALLDIEDYIMEIAEETQAAVAQSPKPFQVAGTNTTAVTQGTANPAEVQKILAKPLDEWTKEEVDLVKEHRTRSS